MGKGNRKILHGPKAPQGALPARGGHAHRGNMACRIENPMQEDKQVDDRMEISKMRLRKFDSIERVVNVHGDTEAWNELQWLLKLAKTNFAACYNTESQCPYVYDDAVAALIDRFPPNDGNRDYITQVCRWLYAQAEEKCTCGAPPFITGCDNEVATGGDSEDECTCTTGECPWTLHTGVFL